MNCNHTCAECGKHETGNWMDDKAKKLTDAKLCFNCDFWTDYVGRKDSPKSVRIDGQHYWIGPPESSSRWAGFGGRRFDIKFHDGRTVFTNNLWAQSAIPERFRDRLPDNAAFVVEAARTGANT